MKLNETTFFEFLDFVNREKRTMSVKRDYVTDNALKVMYDLMKDNLECKGRRLKVLYKGSFVSEFTSPLEYEPKREDYVWNLFHEVWCKTEWAVRCGRDPRALGYEAVKSEFGLSIIKALKEAV